MVPVTFIPVRSQEFVLQIDDYQGGAAKGRLYHRRCPAGEMFSGAADIILKIENILDIEEGPAPEPCDLTAPPETGRGELATVRLEVLFRKNSTWQGKLVWQEQNVETGYRSVMELILIVHEILKR